MDTRDFSPVHRLAEAGVGCECLSAELVPVFDFKLGLVLGTGELGGFDEQPLMQFNSSSLEEWAKISRVLGFSTIEGGIPCSSSDPEKAGPYWGNSSARSSS